MELIARSRTAEELTPEEVLEVRQHLKEVLGSPAFAGSKRAQDFLRLVVGHALDGEYDALRERMIGAEMFGRPVDYDTGSDSVVRVKATEVRKKLAQYYLGSGPHSLRIELPSGSYAPRFLYEQPERAAEAEEISSPGPEEATEVVAASLQEVSGIEEFVPAEQVKHPHPFIAVGVALMLVLLVVFGVQRWFFAGEVTVIRSIAVLPLQNHSGVPDQEYLADGMTQELAKDLTQQGVLRVASGSSVASYAGFQKSPAEIAKALGVDGVLEGNLLREGSRILLYLRLVDGRTGKLVWMHSYVRDLRSASAWEGEVSQAIVKEIAVAAKEKTQKNHADDLVAQDLYLHGKYLLESEDCLNGADYFRAALNVNFSYPQALADLAFCDGHLGETDRVNSRDAFAVQKIEALKAIELDGEMAEGHAELANAEINSSWDWAAAGTEFRRALDLSPKSASIHEEYERYLVRTGRVRETLAEVQKGEDLDPFSSRLYHLEGVILYYCRQYDQALLLVQKVRTMDIPPPNWHFLLGEIDAEKGAYADSISEFSKAGTRPQTLGHLGNVYARAGKTADAMAILPQLEDTVRTEGIGRYEIALVYAGMGKKAEAFKWLEEAFKAHDQGITYLKVEPCLDPLRGDPRFDDLLSRVGLAQ